jgi:predicted RNase H-like nuclease (RuvC/YqgF family)
LNVSENPQGRDAVEAPDAERRSNAEESGLHDELSARALFEKVTHQKRELDRLEGDLEEAELQKTLLAAKFDELAAKYEQRGRELEQSRARLAEECIARLYWAG